MSRVRVQCSLPRWLADVIDRRAAAAGVRGRARFVGMIVEAYGRVMARGPLTAGAQAHTVYEEITRMFDEYSDTEGADWGAKPIQKRNVSHD